MGWLDDKHEELSKWIYAEWPDGVLLCGDCIEICSAIPDKSINLIINDPPYNIGKAHWDKIPNYLEWCGQWLKQAERVLMDNGSFYLFHNDFMTMMKLLFLTDERTEFIFKQQIVWNKRFGGMADGTFNWRIFNNGFRNYSQMAEYILFYTFQDETGLSRIYNDRDCFASIKEYMWKEKQKAGLHTCKQVNEILGTATQGGGMATHYFNLGHTQWSLPTAEMYAKLQTTDYFQRPYEDLRREYEDLRYTFNNQKTHHSVWNYETVKNPVHPTQKPVPLIENIILHSSNEVDIVLDMFAGSGTTGVACIRNKRSFVLIEKEKKYCQIAKQRIDAAYRLRQFERKQLDLFQEAAGD